MKLTSRVILPVTMLVMVGLLTAIHFGQTAIYRKAVATFGLFQEARRDLGQGLIATVLGDRAGTAFVRDSGLALLGQTSDSLMGFRNAWIPEMGESSQVAKLVLLFQDKLTQTKTMAQSLHQPEDYVSLRLALYSLDTVIDEIDRSARQDLDALNRRLGQEFVLIIAAAVLLILGGAQKFNKTVRERQAAQDRLEQVGRNARIGLWYRELATGRIEATDRWKSLLGLGPGEEISDLRALVQHFHPDDRQQGLEEIEGWIASGSSDGEFERRVVYSDGSIHWILFVASLVRNAAGQAVGVSGSAIDITERKKLEADRESLTAQVIQAQKTEALGRLAGGIAHDINNLLVPILTYSDLGRSPRSAHPTEYYFERIKGVAERASTLTRRILAFSRQQVLERKVVDLNALLADFEPIVRRMLPETIRFEVAMAPGLPPVLADAGQVEQVILNLALNARDAMPDGGILGLSTEFQVLDEGFVGTHYGTTPGPQVVLTVTDTGTGMESAVLGQIFDPFFTTKPRGQGTGLGLSTVQGIVRQHGGQISVYSEPGNGAVFKVYWPAQTADGTGETTPALAHAAGGSETILVVEDDEAVREVVKESLENRGYQVVSVPGGKEALDVQNAFDLLVTDVVMPDMDGGTLFRELAARRPGLRVLFMSGYTDKLVSTEEAPGRGFLQKPFSADALDRKIRDLLDQGLPANTN